MRILQGLTAFVYLHCGITKEEDDGAKYSNKPAHSANQGIRRKYTDGFISVFDY